MTEIKTRLTQAEQQALQAKLFALLARQARNYTKGESDSVPVETAQALFEETWAAKVAPGALRLDLFYSGAGLRRPRRTGQGAAGP